MNQVREYESRTRVMETAVIYLQDEGYEARLRTDYSGRFMFGMITPGIVTSASPMAVGVAMAAALGSECIDYKTMYVNTVTDSMGYDTIYYYRS